MKKIVISLLALSTLFLYSCKQNLDKVNVKLIHKKDIVLGMKTSDMPLQVYSSDSNIFLVTYDRSKNKINFKSLYKKNNFDVKINEKIKISDTEIYVHNLDSIFIIDLKRDTAKKSKLFLINSDGYILNSWTTEQLNLNKKKPIIYSKENNFPVIMISKNVYVYAASLLNWSRMTRAKRIRFHKDNERFAEINLFDSNITTNYINVEVPQEIKNGDIYMPSNAFQTFGENNKYMIFSYAHLDSIQIFDRETRQIISKKRIKSKYSKKMEILPDEDAQNVPKIFEYFVESFSYGKIVYDKYRNIYYRVARHAIAYQKDENTVNTLSDKPWSLIVINKDFEVIDEIKFEDGNTYSHYFVVFPAPEGLYLRKNLGKDNTKDSIGVSLFDIKIEK